MNLWIAILIAWLIGMVIIILIWLRVKRSERRFEDKPFTKTDEIHGDVPRVEKEYYRGRKL